MSLPPALRFALLMLVWPVGAWAYIDPGAGMVLWQVLVAAVGAAAVFVRHPVDSIKRFMHHWRRKP